MLECNVTRARARANVRVWPAPSGMDAEEDGAGPSVVVVESDSAGPSATVTEVSRSEIWWCWSQRVNAVEDYRRSEWVMMRMRIPSIILITHVYVYEGVLIILLTDKLNFIDVFCGCCCCSGVNDPLVDLFLRTTTIITTRTTITMLYNMRDEIL